MLKLPSSLIRKACKIYYETLLIKERKKGGKKDYLQIYVDGLVRFSIKNDNVI